MQQNLDGNIWFLLVSGYTDLIYLMSLRAIQD